eukprot:NODE_214_length_2721_cov_5.693488_g196_i0.p1 GENE.NODE_214_length_2721_cov_5.693488_g196_i0~~NODE_214_length_2721_cov_5.693488_g196_i0.p1  ORF type:complete len:838 (-),score=115.60 NODE_214_length_2721_cov_5.693488_g196_i0:116-2629(-)
MPKKPTAMDRLEMETILVERAEVLPWYVWTLQSRWDAEYPSLESAFGIRPLTKPQSQPQCTLSGKEPAQSSSSSLSKAKPIRKGARDLDSVGHLKGVRSRSMNPRSIARQPALESVEIRKRSSSQAPSPRLPPLRPRNIERRLDDAEPREERTEPEEESPATEEYEGEEFEDLVTESDFEPGAGEENRSSVDPALVDGEQCESEVPADDESCLLPAETEDVNDLLARELEFVSGEDKVVEDKGEPEKTADGKWTVVRTVMPVISNLRQGDRLLPVAPTVYFRPQDGAVRDCRPSNISGALLLKPTNRAQGMFFKMGEGAVPFRVVLNTFSRNGFKRIDDNRFNVYWGKRIAPEEYLALEPFQKVNHIPGTWGVGRKDNLWRNLSRMRRRFGATAFPFVPTTFILPGDYRLLAQEWAQKPRTLIIKPVASACGRGIRVIHRYTLFVAANFCSPPPSFIGHSLPRPDQYRQCLAQYYVRRPLLANGFKFDLRIYVVVTSFDPLRIFLYRDGLVRFASEAYSSRTLNNKFVHLTNYCVNSKNPNLANGASSPPEGAKWMLSQLMEWWKHQADMPRPWDDVWSSIQDLIVKTFLAIEDAAVQQTHRLVRHSNCCFELFGFDVLLDQRARPILLEVNIMPSLCPSSPADRQLKSSLIADMLTLVGCVPFDRQKFKQFEETLARRRAPAGGSASAASQAQASKAMQQWLMSDSPLSAFMHLLADSDKDMLMYSDEESARSGNFVRIFPTSDGLAKYGQFFASPRHYNLLLNKWEQHKCGISSFHPAPRGPVSQKCVPKPAPARKSLSSESSKAAAKSLPFSPASRAAAKQKGGSSMGKARVFK